MIGGKEDPGTTDLKPQDENVAVKLMSTNDLILIIMKEKMTENTFYGLGIAPGADQGHTSVFLFILTVRVRRFFTLVFLLAVSC